MSRNNIYKDRTFIFLQLIHYFLQSDQYQWRIIFLLTAAVYSTTAFFFVCFASGEIQSWNDIPKEDEENAAKRSNQCSNS